jgi:hypothetical protein
MNSRLIFLKSKICRNIHKTKTKIHIAQHKPYHTINQACTNHIIMFNSFTINKQHSQLCSTEQKLRFTTKILAKTKLWILHYYPLKRSYVLVVSIKQIMTQFYNLAFHPPSCISRAWFQLTFNYPNWRYLKR